MITRWRLPTEKKLIFHYVLIIGCVLVCILWFYLFNKINTLQETIQNKNTLLAFMQKADQELQQNGDGIESNQSASQHSNTSLSATVQTAINQTLLSTKVTQLRLMENNTLQLAFKQANFDVLMRLLTTLSEKNGIQVKEARIRKDEKPNTVNAEIVLSNP